MGVDSGSVPSTAAREVARVEVPGARGGTLVVLPGAGGRPLVLVRSGRECRVLRPDGSAERLIAPWSHEFGQAALAPDGRTVVFAGPHALRAVAVATGRTVWEVRHRCWEGCPGHDSPVEFADDRAHRYAAHGAVAFSADGRLVWAHVPGAPAGAEPVGEAEELWLLDALEGGIRARWDADSGGAAGSSPTGLPTSGQWVTSIGYGQDGAAMRWVRGAEPGAVVEDFGQADLVGLSVSPSGRLLMTVDHDQAELAVRTLPVEAAAGTEVLAAVAAEGLFPPHPDSGEDFDPEEFPACFDWTGGFLDEGTLLVGTEDWDDERGPGRHWLLDAGTLRPVGLLAYPDDEAGARPEPLGDGTWWTYDRDRERVRVWSR
ncbi:hypothetical protein ACN20G_32625 (plasmid) [Streptomyces sp. BI20]|uniref:hypothetical protein n=1 Tax=Streptomyces sp. BI20 TaxID=3403460 RepID=UPI003C731D58